MHTSETAKILEEIGLSKAETAVYLSLLRGAESIQQILKSTGEKRPTVYYSLNSLEKRGLVSKTGKEYGNKFRVEPIDKLEELVNKNIRQQIALLDKTKIIRDHFPTHPQTPKVALSYFDSFESVRSAIFYSLYATEKHIRSIVPAQNFFHEVGSDFVEEYVREKVKRNIRTTALWEDIPQKHVLSTYYRDSTIRQLPADMHNSFDTTVFMYDDKTLYVAPKKENYAVLIQSHAHSKLMRAVFENMWAGAIPLR